jgi:hypothetical protein
MSAVGLCDTFQEIIKGEDLQEEQLGVTVIGTVLLLVYLLQVGLFHDSIQPSVPLAFSGECTECAGSLFKVRLIVTYESLTRNQVEMHNGDFIKMNNHLLISIMLFTFRLERSRDG